jgi:uncharacterized ubiquitin-like protein YukD
LPRLPFDHNPLILHTASPSPPNVPPFRFEKQWLGYENFTELLTGWWYSFALAGDLANQWRSKLQFIRKNVEVGIEISKLNNLRKKNECISEINKYEILQEDDLLTDEDIAYLQTCHTHLENILDAEEYYWQQRARLKWLLEGDNNTKKLYICYK